MGKIYKFEGWHSAECEREWAGKILSFQCLDNDCDYCDAGFCATGALMPFRCPECGKYVFPVAVFETCTWLERVNFMLNKLDPLNLFSEWRRARKKFLGPEIWEFPWWMLKRICWWISMAQLATPGLAELEIWWVEWDI